MNFRNHQGGLSRFEFGVVVAVIAILATILLGRMLHNEAIAERLYVDLSLRSLQKALKVREGSLMNNDQLIDYASLARENPFSWTEKKPAGYLGETDNMDPGEVEAGGWVYDRGQRELWYRPRLMSEFEDIADGYGLVRIHAVPVYQPGAAAPSAVDVRYKPVAR